MGEQVPKRPWPDPITLNTLPKISESIKKDVAAFGHLPPFFAAMYHVLAAGIKGAEKLERSQKK